MFNFFQTKITDDFSEEMVKDAKSKLLLPLSELFKLCFDNFVKGNKMELNCLLRSVLEQKQTPNFASLIGWFALNDLIPNETLQLYIKMLISIKDTYEGEKCCVAFAQEVLIFGYKFPSFLEEIATTPGFCFRHPDLFIAISQVLETTVYIDRQVSMNIFSVPSEEKPITISINSSSKLPPIVAQQNEPPVKSTLEECINASVDMSDENRRHYLISYVLNVPFPKTIREHPKVLLEAVCVYAQHLLNSVSDIVKSQNRWKRYDLHMQVHQIGKWIGLLTISNGPPPPLCLINMHNVLKESISKGCFQEAVILLAGYFSQASSVYALPCPYTAGILEIMAAFVNSPGVRLDTIQTVDAFATLIGTRVSLLLDRKIKIEAPFEDLHAVFQKNNEEETYFLDTYKEGAVINNNPEVIQDFFSSKISTTKLEDDLFKRAEEVYKYYFVGEGDVLSLQNNLNIDLKTALSLATSQNSVLSKTASKVIFHLLSKSNTPQKQQLRSFFPNRNILKAYIDSNSIDPVELCNFLCDVLTNPFLGQIALPIVQKMMNNIFKLHRKHPNVSFAALYAITGVFPPEEDTKIPSPDSKHINILKYFIQYCKTGTDESRDLFIDSFVPGTYQQVKALILLLLASVNEDNVDYSAINNYAAVLPFLLPKLVEESLITGLLKAYELLTHSAVVAHQSAVFRVMYETLNVIEVAPIRLIPFFVNYSPGQIPSFAASWMQLVLHPKVFPGFMESSNPTVIGFCIRFVITIIKLAVKMPEQFYKPVIRALMTITDSFPLFVTSYHCLFLEHVPQQFTQIRNVILCADPKTDATIPPPVGVFVGNSQEMQELKDKVKPILLDKQKIGVKDTINEIRDTINNIEKTDKSIVWRFVVFCIALYSKVNENFETKSEVVDLFVVLIESLPEFIPALMDHVRYENSHTKATVNILYAVFVSLNSEMREIFFVEMIRRILCVTQPPNAIKNLFISIWNENKDEIIKFINLNGDSAYLKDVIKVINSLPGYNIRY